MTEKMTEGQLWEWMMQGNYPPGYPDINRLKLDKLERRAFATLARDIVMKKWQGHDKPDLVVKVPAGTRIKVVMASRMGDVGITDDLSAHHGYHYRVTCVDSEFVLGDEYIELHPENLLLDIEPIEDPRSDKVRLAFPEQSNRN